MKKSLASEPVDVGSLKNYPLPLFKVSEASPEFQKRHGMRGAECWLFSGDRTVGVKGINAEENNT